MNVLNNTSFRLYSHIIRAMYELSYETVEITGPQMVLTMKLTTFAWNVWDGRRPVEVRRDNPMLHDFVGSFLPTQDLDRWQLEKRVVKFPSILEFLGYSYGVMSYH
jgi:lysophospholipid acyltransferase